REQLAALESAPDLAAVGCHVRLFPRRTLRDRRRAYELWLNAIDSPRRVREEAFVECPVAHPTLMIRREILADLGYRDRGWPEDYDLVLRLLCAGHDVGVVPRRLLAWRDRPVRLSRTADRYGLDRFTACKAAFLAAHFLAATEAYVLWGYGPTGRALRRALLAEGKQPSHIVELHPGRIGNTIHGACVLPPDALRKLPGRRRPWRVPRRRLRAAARRPALRGRAFRAVGDVGRGDQRGAHRGRQDAGGDDAVLAGNRRRPAGGGERPLLPRRRPPPLPADAR